ncbi:LysM peptidoglycan-binding domain-containing protein [Luteolibacter sp. GHJ8]|uniref:LysM peptidoglycan-binding domain-containing protein n=1 Tax=Luteolibacter rhizosphaerae TaxID=2989719 RepID=A0ABT3G915_9BACT|nr:LysM peptidoglycan-binding domain-containing protein [Luteolibacter rhizosphaerae]MCW1915959.1 LysM peptidoglycan-binding domain-containing protein [Luteolibacter rhizosphaerae]
MTSTRYLALAALAFALPSCSMFKKGGGDENYDTGGEAGYDTSNPYGVPDGGSGESVPYQPVNPPAAENPTYGQAAYESNTTTPAPHTPEPSAPAAPRAAAAASTSHTVVRGDTLGAIARKYGTTAAAIKQANGMTSDTVVLGKTLAIPGSSGPVARPAASAGGGGKTYVVVRGDTLSSIARKNGTTVAAIKKANGMSSDTVVLGAKLRIP